MSRTRTRSDRGLCTHAAHDVRARATSQESPSSTPRASRRSFARTGCRRADRDEASGRTATRGDKPLAADGAHGPQGRPRRPGCPQNDLARLSTNSAHRVLDNATHSKMTEDKTTAEKSAKGYSTLSTPYAPRNRSKRRKLRALPYKGGIGRPLRRPKPELGAGTFERRAGRRLRRGA
jgi:hypothetical protein